MQPKTIRTIGHSTHTIEDFIAFLKASAITALVDVRRYPASRRYPHFNASALSDSLARSGIRYIHMEALGGRRSPRPDSVNTGWRNKSFRGYADYMQTEPFLKAVSELEELAQKEDVAIMCSEAVWWSCHRSLVSDYLKAKGWEVFHITGAAREQLHPYTSPAKITASRLSYRQDGELPFT